MHLKNCIDTVVGSNAQFKQGSEKGISLFSKRKQCLPAVTLVII